MKCEKCQDKHILYDKKVLSLQSLCSFLKKKAKTNSVMYK